MLRQCELSIESYGIKKPEIAKTQLEAGISITMGSFGSEGDEDAEDECCVPTRKRTMGSPGARSIGKVVSGRSLTHYDNQQAKQASGLMRLLQFSGTLSSEGPQKQHLSYWDDVIREYFTPGAIMSLIFWKDNQRIEAKLFEIGVPILPRFFLVTTQSGVKSMALSLDSAMERVYQNGQTIVECVGASWTYSYRNGYTVTLRGPLTVHLISISRGPRGSHTGSYSESTFKFDKFQFDANFHDKSIALESILGARSIEHREAPSFSVQTAAGTGPVGQSRSDQPQADDERNEEPRVLIDYASLPGEPVNAFGITQAAMRCLEISDCVTSMAELIQFSKESSLGPVDALKEYAGRLRESGSVLLSQFPTQPPLPVYSMNVYPPLHQAPPSAASFATLNASPSELANDAIPLIDDEQHPQKRVPRKYVRTENSRKRAKMESSTNSSMTSGRKNLSLLPTMPLDILFEILGHLSPKDILSISRASKIFRETLMTRSATTVWKAARNRLGAPECPSWMSEPAWAALLFGHICESCGTSNVHNVDFLLLKRVCALCKKTHLLTGSKTAGRYPGILDFVPSTNAGYRGRPGSSHYYWDTDLERMVERLSKLEADVKEDHSNSQNILFDFKEEHRRRVTQIQQASHQWRAWSRNVQQERHLEKMEAQSRRISQIKEKFRELGYTDEDIYIPWSQREFRSTVPLTEKSWIRIRPMLEPQAMVRKADRLRKEETKIRCDRRHIIHLRYKDYQRTLCPSQWRYLPHTWDIIAYELFARHVEAPVGVQVTVATFDDAFAHLPGLLASTMEQRKNSLRILLPNSFNEDGTIDANLDAMNLAMAAFRCKRDSAFLFGWDDVASHHCQEQEGSLWGFNADLRPQTSTPAVEYSPFAAGIVKRVAQILGLDCAVTPADLDEENLRFSCDSCRSYKEGDDYYEAGYDWRTLTDHMHASLGLHNNITVLSSRDAVEVQQCERDETWAARRWTCTHCPEHLDNLQTRHVVFQHLRDSHAIEEPSELTDFLFFQRHRKGWTNQPRYMVYKTAEPAPLFRCLLCPKTNSTSDSAYILPNIEGHLKHIHQVVDMEVGVNCEAVLSKVLVQPLSSVRTVKHYLV